MNYAKLIGEPIPQSEPLDRRQVANNASGFVYQIDIWARLDRWLILGSDSPTYYQSAKKLTRDNAVVVAECWDADEIRTAARIAEISLSGRAPKNDAAIFALAIGASMMTGGKAEVIRSHAFAQITKVCRTATHLFQFVDLCMALGRGWGPALRKAIVRWYSEKTADKLAYQMIKYRSREHYSHKRLLDCAHGDKTFYLNEQRAALVNWARGRTLRPEQQAVLPGIVGAHLEAMKTADNVDRIIELVLDWNLPWEAIPTEVTKNPDVWAVMLPTMGMTALIRNLGKMTSIGLIKPLSDVVPRIVSRLTHVEELRQGRIHPFTVLQALAVYRSGHGVRGELSWKPVGQIVDALEAAFYAAFRVVEPTGKRTMIGLDVSNSMSESFGGSPLTVAEAAAAMAMVTIKTEKNWDVMAFNHGFQKLPLTARMSLPEVLRHTQNVNFGGTDCALPMIYAAHHSMEVDVFIVVTDNETRSGRVHPMQALRDYRKKSGIHAKLVVIGMTSTGFSIADSQDGGALDCVGWDSDAPSVIADFIRG